MAGLSGRHVLDDAQGLVGRAYKRSLLDQHARAAVAGRGSVVLIGGEGGIGKTALAIASAISSHGACILMGHAYELTDTPPYGPWLDLFDRVPAATSSLPALAHDIAHGKPVVRASHQTALFDQVLQSLAAASDQQPLILILDDLHWADPASLDLLRFLACELGTLPILLLVTYHADEVTRVHRLYTLIPTLVREARAAALHRPRTISAALPWQRGQRRLPWSSSMARVVSEQRGYSDSPSAPTAATSHWGSRPSRSGSGSAGWTAAPLQDEVKRCHTV